MKILKLIQDVCNRSSDYYPFICALTIDSRASLQSEEFRKIRNSKNLIPVTDEEKLQNMKIIAIDCPYYALELIENYLKRNHPEAKLAQDGGRVKIDNTSQFSDIEKTTLVYMMAEINEDMDDIAEDLPASFENLRYTSSFIIKELIKNHSKYQPLNEGFTRDFKELVQKLEDAGFPDTDPQLKFTKETYKKACIDQDRAFNPDNFIAFLNEVINCKDRLDKIRRYAPELEGLAKEELDELEKPIKISTETYNPGEEIKGDGDTIRRFCLNATDDEFKNLKEELKKRSKRSPYRLRDIQQPTENSIKKSIAPSYKSSNGAQKFPYDEPEKFLISNRKSKEIELYARVDFLNASLEPIDLTREDSDILNILNTFFYAYGKTGKIKLFVSDVYREMHTSAPNAEVIDKLEKRISELSSYWSQRILVLENKKTGEVRELTPQNLKNLDYFLNLTELGYTPTTRELLWAIKTERILKIDGLGHDENKNGTISKSFILEEQPIMNKLAEDRHQVTKCPSSIIRRTGKNNQTRAIRDAIVQYLSMPYSRAPKVINIPSFLKSAGVIASEDEYTREKKRYLNDWLEDILCLFCAEGKIEDYILVIEAERLIIKNALKLKPNLTEKKKAEAIQKHIEHGKRKEEELKKQLENLNRKSFTQKTGLKGSEIPTDRTPKYQESKHQKPKSGEVPLKDKAPTMIGWIAKGKIGLKK